MRRGWTSSIALALALLLVIMPRAQAAEFEHLVVFPSAPYTDSVSSYTMLFALNSNVFGRLHNSRLTFEFPDGFDLHSVDSAKVFTDRHNQQIKVERVTVSNQTVVIRLDKKEDDEVTSFSAADKVKFKVVIYSVLNTSVAGMYQLTGEIIKRDEAIAGPTVSQPFDIMPVLTGPKPAVQILATDVVSPNRPKVNTGQEFRIYSKVKNFGTTAAHTRVFISASDGNSSFDAYGVVTEIQPGGVVSIPNIVIAAGEPNSGETFLVGLDTTHVSEVPAIDNEATAIIQTPALLEVTSNIEDGGVINLGNRSTLDVTFSLINHGQAGVSEGEYTLTVIDTQVNGDTVVQSGSISVGTPVEYTYFSSNTGQAVLINFEVDGPIDANNLQPAPFIDSDVSFTVIEAPVFPSNPRDSFIVENNPFDPNDGPVEFQYILSRDMPIDFMVFTIIGEEVYSKKYDAGANGGQAGQNSVMWDGRNDKGYMVLNGAYLAIISNDILDFKAKLKLAVLK